MTRRRNVATAIVYGTLATLAVVFAAFRGRSVVSLEESWLGLPALEANVVSLALGAVTAMLVVMSTKWLVRRARWARLLHVEFRELLGPMSTVQIAFFALSSGVAEELFFRGAVQPELGLVITAVLFGAVHIGPARRFLPWTIWATMMGLVFGVIYECTGQLAGVVLAHVWINYRNMLFIDGYDPAPRVRGSVSDPGLVSSRLRSGSRAH